MVSTASNITVQLVILSQWKRFSAFAGAGTITARADATTSDGLTPQPSPSGFASFAAKVNAMDWHFDSFDNKFHVAQLQLPLMPLYSIVQDETIVFTIAPEAFEDACEGSREAQLVVTCTNPSFLLPASRALAALAGAASVLALVGGTGGLPIFAQSQLTGVLGLAPCAPVQSAVAAGLEAFLVAPAFRSGPEAMMLTNLVIAVGVLVANVAVLTFIASMPARQRWAAARFPYLAVAGVSLCAKGFSIGAIKSFESASTSPVTIAIGSVGVLLFLSAVPLYCLWHQRLRPVAIGSDDRLAFFRLSEFHPIRSSTKKGLSVLMLPSGYWDAAAERKSLRHVTWTVAGRSWAGAYPLVLSLALGLVGGANVQDCSGLMYALGAIVLFFCVVFAVARPCAVPFVHVGTLSVHVLFALQLITAGQYLASPGVNVVLVFSAGSCAMSLAIFVNSLHAVWLGVKEERIIMQDTYCRDDNAALIVPSFGLEQREEAPPGELGRATSSVRKDRNADSKTLAEQFASSGPMIATSARYKECSAVRLDCATSLRRMIVLSSVYPAFLSAQERRIRLAALIAVTCQHALLDRLVDDVADHIGTLL